MPSWVEVTVTLGATNSNGSAPKSRGGGAWLLAVTAQVVCPGVDVLPLGHSWQGVLGRRSSSYCPAAHWAQLAERPSEYVPMGHIETPNPGSTGGGGGAGATQSLSATLPSREVVPSVQRTLAQAERKVSSASWRSERGGVRTSMRLLRLRWWVEMCQLDTKCTMCHLPCRCTCPLHSRCTACCPTKSKHPCCTGRLLRVAAEEEAARFRQAAL